jgi:hypothetical protein
MGLPATAAARPPTPEPAANVSRITSADARAVLDRLAGTDLIARGSVAIVSVEAIRERTGERWPRKCDDVWGYLERKCDEHLSFEDLRRRVNETDFLIVMLSEEGLAAQATCLKILEEVLVFFLGAADLGDLRLRGVTAVDGDTITTAPIDPARIARTTAPRSAMAALEDARAAARSSVSFVTVAGERVRVDYGMEEVVSLRHRTTACVRIEPTVTSMDTGQLIPVRAFPKLADDDIAFIDSSTFAYGAALLPQDAGPAPVLILPVSFRTVGARKGRAGLIAVDGACPGELRRRVMVELVDVDLGTPTARLAEVVALSGQLCRAVTARAWPSRDCLAPLRGARLHGVAFDLRDFAWDELRLAALLRAMGQQLHRKAPAVIAQGLAAESWFACAEAAGFTHASRVASAPTPPPANPGSWSPAPSLPSTPAARAGTAALRGIPSG